MQTSKLHVILFLLLVSITGAIAQQNKYPEEVISAWQKMWNTYNLAQVDEVFVADPSVTYFSSEYAGLIQGIEALRQHHARFGFVNGGKVSGNKLWLENVNYKQSVQTSLVTATWYFQRQGSEQRQAGPVTFMLVRSKSGWRISHAHFSNNP